MVLFAMLATPGAFGQAVFETQSTASHQYVPASLTRSFNHTTSSSPNRLLLVSLAINLNDAFNVTASASYNSVAMEPLGAAVSPGFFPDVAVVVWYLLDPPAGTHTVAVTLTGVTGGETANAVLTATTWNNALQSAPVFAAAADDEGNPSVTLTTTATDRIIDYTVVRENDPLTVGPGQLERSNISFDGTDDVDLQAGSSTENGAAGSTTMSWTIDNREWAQVAVRVESAPFAPSLVCGTQPGKDGAGGTLAGIDNDYWPATASASAGATSIALGTRRTGGAGNSITAGDLLLVMQMQDAAIDSSNDTRYGDGSGTAGDTTTIGSGYTNANNVGRYEYVVATNTIGAAGGTVTFNGGGPGGGLAFSYTNAAATGTQGQRRFQVIRVPQWTTATLGSTLTAASWNGSTGGVLAFDAVGDVALGGATVSVNGLGFRGGAGLADTAGSGSNTEYRTLFGNGNAAKGEGIAGTPRHVYDGSGNVDLGAQGYPNGDQARGAPGNAGGGGTDGDPANNDENSGGGGGGNGGAGGRGGNTWQSNLPRGGFGGSSFPATPGRVVLGGGGGAGTRNNSADPASAGARGGGIVLIRAGRLTGTGTITANGSDAYNLTLNDGGGGGGAGGSIVVLSYGGGLGSLTLSANGGRGGDGWATEPPAGDPGERHGPGGGGGGGYIATSGAPAAVSVAAGANGITTTVASAFNATPGSPGVAVPDATFDDVTGVSAACTDLSVASSDSPDPVYAGNNLTFTQSVTNNSTIVPAANATITQTIPAGTTFVSMTPPAGWTCTTPAVGGTGTVTCTKTTPLMPSTSSGSFVLVVATDQALTDGSTITQPVAVSASNPETILANNSTSTTTTVQRRVDIAVTKVTSDPGEDMAFAEGETLTYTINVTNNGPSRATNVVLTDPLPAGFAFVSVAPGGSCSHAAGTVTCTWATMNAAASNAVTISGTITVNTTEIVNTASTTRTETDTNAANDSASATAFVLAPTAVELFDASAVQNGDGEVELAWTTSLEVRNLGFHVYRETGGKRERITRELIAGSAFFTRTQRLDGGRTYAWKDRVAPGAFVQYFIEDVDLNGTRVLHGPVTPVLNASRSAGRAIATTSETLSEISESAEGNGVFVSHPGIGAPARAAHAPTAAQRRAHQQMLARGAAKLQVQTEGWYRVTRSQLAASGYDPGSDSSRLALFAGGVEQPIVVDDGGDGRFDAADAIEFYGVGIDLPSSGERPYWLTKGTRPGGRIKSERATGGRVTAKSTSFTFERIERTVFVATVLNNGERDNFFGAVVTAEGASQELTVTEREPGTTAKLEVVLQGATPATHRIDVELNGVGLGEIEFTGDARSVASFNVPASALAEGANELVLTALEGDEDVSVVEAVRLTFTSLLEAREDVLKVRLPGRSKAVVAGFTSSAIRAVDVTTPGKPVLLQVRVTGGGTDYRAEFTAPAGSERTVLLFATSAIGEPAVITAQQGTDWSGRWNRADLLIVTPRELAAEAGPLAALRRAEGLKVGIVPLEEIDDQFDFGIPGPDALRAFLDATRGWQQRPRFVLLLGDATVDPRDYLGQGTFASVPTKLVPTTYLKTASDDWFADFSDRGIPEIAIGRLPARSADEAELMIAKLLDRDPSSKRVAFLADANDQDNDFEEASARMEGSVPGGYDTVTFATGQIADDGAAVTSAFDSLVVVYTGHGSMNYWNAGPTGEGEFADIDAGGTLPIVAAMTCLNGYFHELYGASMAETLMLNPNGASAVWASSTLTEMLPQADMGEAMLHHLFRGARLGEAVMRSKSATDDPDVRRSWILFGDPSMPLD